MTCAYQIVVNKTRALSSAEQVNWMNMLNALYNDVTNIHTQLAAIQAALAAGTALGAGYSGFALNAQQFLPTT